MRAWLVIVVVTAAAGLTCCYHVGGTASGATTAVALAPRITAVSPDTAVFGMPVTITIIGVGFAPDSNRVVIGPVRVKTGSVDGRGTVLRVSVPPALPSVGEVPPPRLPPGTYAVTVTTRAGTSNAVPLTLVWREGHGPVPHS